VDRPVGFAHEGLSLVAPPRSNYTTPGYYVIDRYGGAQDGPFDSYSLAIANLNGRDGIQYLDQDKTAPLTEPFPPGMNTVTGNIKTARELRCTQCGNEVSPTNTGSAVINWGSCPNGGSHIPEWGPDQEPLVKESNMNNMNESDILEAIRLNPKEARTLMAYLEEVRKEARLSKEAAQSIDLANTYIKDVFTPVPTHGSHTAASDWMGEMWDSPPPESREIISKASAWYSRVSREVRDDRKEFLIQAHGKAKQEGSRYGSHMAQAIEIFMDHVDKVNALTHKVAMDSLLPWSSVVPPLSQIAPVMGDNPNVPDVPGNTGQAMPLSNAAEMMWASVAPQTPDELAQASSRDSLNFWPNADATPEPNDDGMLAQEGQPSQGGSRQARQAGFPSAQGEDPTFGTTSGVPMDWDNPNQPLQYGQTPTPAFNNQTGQYGQGMVPQSTDQAAASQAVDTPGSLAEASSRDSLDFWPNADDSASAGMEREAIRHQANQYIKKSGDEWVIIQKGTGKILSHHNTEDEAEAAFRAMESNMHGGSLRTSSDRFTYRHTPYEEYLKRISEGSYPLGPNLYAGSAAASSPTKNDVTYKMAAYHLADMPYRPEPYESPIQKLIKGPFIPTHTYNPIGWDMFDPRPHSPDKSVVIESGAPVQLIRRMSPPTHGMPTLLHVRDEGGIHQTVDSRSLAKLTKGRKASHTADFEDPDGSQIGYNPAAWNDGPVDLHEAWEQSGNAQSGLPLAPTHMVESFSNISDFPNTGPTRVDANLPSLYARQWIAASQDDENEDDPTDSNSGYETGGRGQGPGSYQPDRSLYAQSPQGQAESTQGYEQAYSSGRPIDYTDTGEEVLGTVPVEGYEYNEDHPNAEMWPWALDSNPIGSGAAQVANVPTPGMVSQSETGLSWPQPVR
jgi:hypothetical protein